MKLMRAILLLFALLIAMVVFVDANKTKKNDSDDNESDNDSDSDSGSGTDEDAKKQDKKLGKLYRDMDKGTKIDLNDSVNKNPCKCVCKEQD